MATSLHQIRWSPFAGIFSPSSTMLFCIFTLSLTDLRQSDGFLPRQPISIGPEGVHLPVFLAPPQLYFAIYLLSLSRTDSWQSNGFLPRQPVSIWSDGVCLSINSTPSSTILCCIFTKSLANWLLVSLVTRGLRPSDSVWVYWTTLFKCVNFSRGAYKSCWMYEIHQISLINKFFLSIFQEWRM